MQGRIQNFKLGEAHLKKNAPSGRSREQFWGISCEKSRFYAKKIIFFPILCFQCTSTITIHIGVILVESGRHHHLIKCNFRSLDTTGATCWAGIAEPSGAPGFTPIYRWVRVDRSLAFCVMIYIVVCPFVLLFCLVIELSVILRYTASNYPYGIFKFFI